ncbi:hypothetical protein DFJ73DRAFT_833852 [Zopfochytrium polystomum]|nr:hypothetical protein DFJ73DRAFT_833852 [Zopfochytrium polystomum]
MDGAQNCRVGGPSGFYFIVFFLPLFLQKLAPSTTSLTNFSSWSLVLLLPTFFFPPRFILFGFSFVAIQSDDDGDSPHSPFEST